MNALDIFKKDFTEYCNFRPFQVSKYEWLAENVFYLTTYDNSINDMFGKKIAEVCRAILDGVTFEYIAKDESSYLTYIIVCQLLDSFHWIEWGTSIRGAWFEEQSFNNAHSRHILHYYKDGCEKLPFTEENIKLLIEFVEAE